MLVSSDPPRRVFYQSEGEMLKKNTRKTMIKTPFFLSSGQLAGGVILGVALWLRHDNQTSSLLILQFEGQQAPGTFYVSEYAPPAARIHNQCMV